MITCKTQATCAWFQLGTAAPCVKALPMRLFDSTSSRSTPCTAASVLCGTSSVSPAPAVKIRGSSSDKRQQRRFEYSRFGVRLKNGLQKSSALPWIVETTEARQQEGMTNTWPRQIFRFEFRAHNWDRPLCLFVLLRARCACHQLC